MTVDQFLLLYKQNNNKEEFVKNQIKTTYLPYNEKIVLCNSVVENTMYETVGDITVFKQNTPGRELFFKLMLINKYTTIEIDVKDDPLEAYDKLNEKGLIYELISNIPEKEFIEINSVLDWVIEDKMINERDIVSFLDSKYQALMLTGTTLFDALSDIKGEDYGEDN